MLAGNGLVGGREEPDDVDLDINMEGNEEPWEDIKADAEKFGLQDTFVDAIQHMSR
jgi:hypothetical protein